MPNGKNILTKITPINYISIMLTLLPDTIIYAEPVGPCGDAANVAKDADTGTPPREVVVAKLAESTLELLISRPEGKKLIVMMESYKFLFLWKNQISISIVQLLINILLFHEILIVGSVLLLQQMHLLQIV